MDSRAYVKGLLKANGKENSATYKSIDGTATCKAGETVQDIDWKQFNPRELNQISKMKLPRTPELARAAEQAKQIVVSKKKPTPAAPNSYRRGPEPI